MTTNQLMFLYAAEELNFTRAAERAFVTQQCLSTHIRVLEEKYGTRLFDRRPKIALTEDGKKLYQAFLSIRHIEEGVQRELSGSPKEMTGELHLGIPHTRVQVMVPEVLAEYHRMYPGVTIHTTLGSTVKLVDQVLDGKLDLAVGVHVMPRQELVRTAITEDAVYLLATRRLLADTLGREAVPGHVPGQEAVSVEEAEADTITPEEIARLPLAITPVSSTIKRLIDQYFVKEQIAPDVVFSIDSYDAALSLCRLHECAFFCPESLLLSEGFRRAVGADAKGEICILKPERFDVRARIELITSSQHYLPGYVQPFASLFVQRYRERIDALRSGDPHLGAQSEDAARDVGIYITGKVKDVLGVNKEEL